LLQKPAAVIFSGEIGSMVKICCKKASKSYAKITWQKNGNDFPRPHVPPNPVFTIGQQIARVIEKTNKG
jgi:ABC-type dipeptide/oligopeptide/nickel transport system ATPase component